MSYLDHLPDLAAQDAQALLEAEKAYGDSWKKRGGVGAFMMLARKWDRIENLVSGNTFGQDLPSTARYDIFLHIQADCRVEGLIDDIRDLRRYLLLVEAEMIARGHAREEVNSEQVRSSGD